MIETISNSARASHLLKKAKTNVFLRASASLRFKFTFQKGVKKGSVAVFRQDGQYPDTIVRESARGLAQSKSSRNLRP
jgi:hypothetical protein